MKVKGAWVRPSAPITLAETGPSPGAGGCWRKQEAALRLRRGEDLELVSRELGVTVAKLTAWRDAFLAAGEASL